MKTTLLEIPSPRGELIRAIVTEGEDRDFGVLMVAGFERAATTEKKFKQLADELAKRGGVSVRLDTTGIGLSDGNYGNLTVQAAAANLTIAGAWLRQNYNLLRLSAVGHSLGTCVVAQAWAALDFERAVFLAPALNQAAILRYNFVRRQDARREVRWDNYTDFLNEAAFARQCAAGLLTKTNRIEPAYFLENADLDYDGVIDPISDRILRVHGDADDKAPAESVTVTFTNEIIVPGGDHDLERPDFLEKWLVPATDFLAR